MHGVKTTGRPQQHRDIWTDERKQDRHCWGLSYLNTMPLQEYCWGLSYLNTLPQRNEHKSLQGRAPSRPRTTPMHTQPPRRKQQWPDLSSPCCAVLNTKLKAMNRFQSHTCTVLTHHSTNEFVYYSIQDQSHSTPFHSSSITFHTFIITKSIHSASKSLTHH